MYRLLRSVLVIAALGFFSVVVSAAGKPNLLLITVDDMNADSVGVYGSGVAGITPNIDQLAKEGLRFSNAHVQVANCMPSRNVMWSGRYPHSSGVEGFYQVRQPDYPVVAELMKKAGYFSAIRHKLKDSTPYFPYEWDLVLDELLGDGKDSGKSAESYGLSTAAGIHAAKLAKKPFFLLINIADPHVPLYGLNRAGEEVHDPYTPSRVYEAGEIAVPGFLIDDPVIRKELAHYYSSVRRADDAVGQIMQSLARSGEADNTLVMFLSDHGMPFPFAKTQLYHHSTHTPLIFRWPGVTKAGSLDSTHMVSAVDLLPTLLDSIGAELPEGLEGRSFLPLLKGGRQGDRDRVIKEYNENGGGRRDPMRAVQTRQFLYIFNPWSDGKRVMASATMGTRTYKRMEELAGTNVQLAQRLGFFRHRVVEEFYDIQNDPDCLINLIADPAYKQEIRKLSDTLEQWMLDTQDPMLDTFVKRQDVAARKTYMREQDRLTRERREWKRAVIESMRKKKPVPQDSTQ